MTVSVCSDLVGILSAYTNVAKLTKIVFIVEISLQLSEASATVFD